MAHTPRLPGRVILGVPTRSHSPRSVDRDLPERSSGRFRSGLSPRHVATGVCEDPFMIEVDLPDGEGVPELVRSFAACVASVTETPVAEVPQLHADLPGAIAHWRSWAGWQGAVLVALAKPAAFNWPGYWL